MKHFTIFLTTMMLLAYTFAYADASTHPPNNSYHPLITAGIRAKPGVDLSEITNYSTQQAAFFTHRLYQALGEELVITSTNTDGSHKEGSRHSVGRAFDIRIVNLRQYSPEEMTFMLHIFLDEYYFDVVLEPTHIHVEYDPDFSKE